MAMNIWIGQSFSSLLRRCFEAISDSCVQPALGWVDKHLNWQYFGPYYEQRYLDYWEYALSSTVLF